MSFLNLFNRLSDKLSTTSKKDLISTTFGLTEALFNLDPLTKLMLSLTCKTLRPLRPTKIERNHVTLYAADSSEKVINLVISLGYTVTKEAVIKVAKNNDMNRLKLFMKRRLASQCALVAAWNAGSTDCAEYLMKKTLCRRCVREGHKNTTVGDCSYHNRNLLHDILAMSRSIAKKEQSPWTRMTADKTIKLGKELNIVHNLYF
jgi:hypothetical protein